jgi:hypothetical protein
MITSGRPPTLPFFTHLWCCVKDYDDNICMNPEMTQRAKMLLQILTKKENILDIERLRMWS